VAFTGQTLKPLSPTQITMTQDPGTFDITISWNRRTRKPTAFRKRTNQAFAQETVQFELDIFQLFFPPSVAHYSHWNTDTWGINLAEFGQGGLTRTVGTGYNTGAVSRQSFGGDDGIFEAYVSMPYVDTSCWHIWGFTSQTSVSALADIDLGVELTATPEINIYESGVLMATLGTLPPRPMKIEYAGGSFNVYYDGIIHYSHKVGVTFPLRVGACLHDPGNTDEFTFYRMPVDTSAKLRTAPVSSAGNGPYSYIYTKAQQDADGNLGEIISDPTEMSVTIYQISEDVQRGIGGNS
jgi:hypothetical protein